MDIPDTKHQKQGKTETADSEKSHVQDSSENPDRTRPNTDEICGICNNPLNDDSEFIGSGLGKIHSRCKYRNIKIKVLTPLVFISMFTNSTINIKEDETADVPALQALQFINKHKAVRV